MHNLFGTIKWLLIVLVLLLLMLLCLENLHVFAPFILLAGKKEYARVPVSLILILPFLAAFITFWVVGMLDQVDHFLLARGLKKRIRDLEREVDQLRKLPIREGTAAQQRVDKENDE